MPSSPTLEELRLDVAWEARRGITDRIACRVCGAFVTVPLGGPSGHLQTHKMSSREYLKSFPAARLQTFNLAVHGKSYGAAESMANFAAMYVTGKELIEARSDVEWEIRQGLDASVCRGCGVKSKYLCTHVKQHGWNLPTYRALFPAAPYESPSGIKARKASMAKYNRTERGKKLAIKRVTRWNNADPARFKKMRAVGRQRKREKLARLPDLERAIKENAIATAAKEKQLQEMARALAESRQEGERLRLESLGEEEKIGAAVEDTIPRFEKLFALPEINQNPKRLKDDWKHSDFTWDEMRAARVASESRKPKQQWPTTAARWFISLTTDRDIATVRSYHNRYLAHKGIAV
jgi:hypothetical protein